jgi:hypothetical protein
VARPRKFGPTITFRLPVELHAIVDEKARAKGMSVNEYVAARFTDALCRQRDGEAATPVPRPAPQPTAKRDVTPIWKASMKT